MTTEYSVKTSVHDPGGKVSIRVQDGIETFALFGGERKEYRYKLSRMWDRYRPAVLFVLMNPSTADESVNDPTVAKCCRYARQWGFGKVWIGNLCAYRSTNPVGLLSANDPVGQQNDVALLEMAADAKTIVFAHGRLPKRLQQRSKDVLSTFVAKGHAEKILILKLCKDGTPSHPLYLRGDMKPVAWRRV